MSNLPWESRSPLLSLRKGENVVQSFGTHWIKYAVPSVMYLLIVSALVVVFVFARINLYDSPVLAHGSFLLGLCLLVWIHHWFFHRILSEGMVDIIITNKRLIFLEDRLWFYDSLHEVALEKIRAVEAKKKGVLGNMFHYGTLWFDTGGSDQDTSVIPLVPNPHLVCKTINELLEST